MAGTSDDPSDPIHQWVADTFGVDPRDYGSLTEAVGGAAAPALAPEPPPILDGPTSGVRLISDAEKVGAAIVGVSAGAIAVGVAAAAAVLTWSTSTAPPWMDEINPETHKPYKDEAEYNAVKKRRADAVRELDRHDHEDHADEVIASYNPAQRGEGDCDPIIDAIKGMVKALRERYDALAELGGGDAGHRQRYTQSQAKLKRLIEMAKFKECPIDTAEAEEWSTYPLP